MSEILVQTFSQGLISASEIANERLKGVLLGMERHVACDSQLLPAIVSKSSALTAFPNR